jgi:hypothetical protein
LAQCNIPSGDRLVQYSFLPPGRNLFGSEKVPATFFTPGVDGARLEILAWNLGIVGNHGRLPGLRAHLRRNQARLGVAHGDGHAGVSCRSYLPPPRPRRRGLSREGEGDGGAAVRRGEALNSRSNRTPQPAPAFLAVPSGHRHALAAAAPSLATKERTARGSILREWRRGGRRWWRGWLGMRVWRAGPPLESNSSARGSRVGPDASLKLSAEICFWTWTVVTITEAESDTDQNRPASSSSPASAAASG